MADSISNFNLAINSLSYLGLDTRAIRKPAPGVAYFEIDDENILAFKKGRLEENGIDTNVRFIPGNYIIDGHIDLLKKSEFDFERPTHFIWEGNTMYLTAAAVSQVFGGITRHVIAHAPFGHGGGCQ
jgi:O-methyltransferase involved in polyketide biosynthesis